MTAITITQFLGANQRLEPKLLPEGQGVQSLGQKPGRGDLRGWLAPTEVMKVPTGTQRKSIYRMGRDVVSDSAYWLAWTGVVHAVRGFDAEDTTERTYYTGDGAPKVTDNQSLTSDNPTVNPTASRPLGLPAPNAAATLTVQDKAGGDPETPEQTVTYVYTYVNDWGWESAPSPPNIPQTKAENKVVKLTGFATVPAGNYNITRVRIYRSQDGDLGSGFYFVGESTPAGNFTDRFTMLGEPIPTTQWLPAPGVPWGGAAPHTEDRLENLTAMWNGMLAGISGNAVRFCEAYTPYAWPMAYDAIPPDSTPVALAVFGQNLLVLTTGRPLLVNGTAPDSLDQQPVEMAQGCIAPRSAVGMGAGVAWASNDGLCWYGAGGARILTARTMTRSDWLALQPQTIIGQMYEGLYYGSYEPVPGQGRKGFLVDPSEGNEAGIYFLDDGFDAAHFDELQDQLYVLRGRSILKWEGGNTRLGVSFTSKVHRLPKPTGFACAEVVATSYPVQLNITADGDSWYSYSVPGREPFRLPAGRAMDWQVQVALPPGANGGVQAVVLAQSMQELAAI